jgi:hypothetical protein
MGRGFAGGLPCQARSEGRPQSVARGSRKAGSGSGGGCGDRDYGLTGGVHPAAGSHLPSEGTAQPFAVAPFASSPFAHPIPQSRRRASGDLFSGSLGCPPRSLAYTGKPQ